MGLRVMRLGGNAVDAAVATALSLAVTYPQAGNLGGGGFMLVKAPGKRAECLDYRETAPRGVKPEHYSYEGERWTWPSVSGGPSVAVPGTVAGMAAALERYGSWGWDRIVGEMVDLAAKGLWITNRQANYYAMYEEALRQYPSTAKIFLPGGILPLPGDNFAQPDLAWSLRQLAEHGADAFYRGAIAERIVKSVHETGGVLDMEDLDEYEPVWREPISRTVWGREVLTAPPPSGGGMVVLTALGLLESLGIRDTAPGSADRYEMIARSLRVAFAKRGQLAGDPLGVPPEAQKEIEELISATFQSDSLERFEEELGLRDASPVRGQTPARNTTHFGVVDRDGLAVSNTYSLNTLFGSKLVAEDTGILLNNTIDDFGLAPGIPNWYQLFEGQYNYLKPGRRPIGSMAPTLVVNGNTVELSIGAAGGPRIPSLVVQVITSVLCDELPLSLAMQAPRVHHQFMPTTVDIEDSIPMATARELERRNLEVLRFPRLGIGAGIHHDLERETFFAALDPRF